MGTWLSLWASGPRAGAERTAPQATGSQQDWPGGASDPAHQAGMINKSHTDSCWVGRAAAKSLLGSLRWRQDSNLAGRRLPGQHNRGRGSTALGLQPGPQVTTFPASLRKPQRKSHQEKGSGPRGTLPCAYGQQDRAGPCAAWLLMDRTQLCSSGPPPPSLWAITLQPRHHVAGKPKLAHVEGLPSQLLLRETGPRQEPASRVDVLVSEPVEDPRPAFDAECARGGLTLLSPSNHTRLSRCVCVVPSHCLGWLVRYSVTRRMATPTCQPWYKRKPWICL